MVFREQIPMTFLHPIKNLYLKLTRGVGCCDLADYDHYIAKKISKDLTLYKKESPQGYPSHLTQEKWDEIIDKMIKGFDLHTSDRYMYEEEEGKSIDEAGELFGKYMFNIWI